MDFNIGDVKPVAIVVAAVANMLLGFIYYHPKVFGTTWADLMGLKMDQMKNAGPAYAFTAVGALMSATALGVIVAAFEAFSWFEGLAVGSLVSVGVLVPVLGMDAVFGGKKIQLYFLSTAYYVLAFILMGVILGAWPA